MKKLLIILAVLALGAGMATAKLSVVPPVTNDNGDQSAGRAVTIFMYDNIEGGNTGWTHGDYTATAPMHFHVDTYMAYAGHSWWCGNFTSGPSGPDADGGYGNSWNDFLKVPTTSWSGYTYPVVSFEQRHDSEVDYDFTYVQAESLGAYINLNRGYDGLSPWAHADFYLGNCDDPAVVRFKFKSDGAWSDQDNGVGGNISNTVGGAFSCDNVKIWDYYTNTTLFLDDVESGGLCVPYIPGTSGDFWHIQQCCKSASMSHCWSIAYPDTSFVQPDLQNWLMTPLVTVTGAGTCTLSFRRHVATPTVDNDYWTEELYIDGTWYAAGAWWGDICNTNGTAYNCYPSPIQGRKAWILDALLPANQVAYRWAYYTTDNGAGPDICNSAGMFIDDFRVAGVLVNAVEESSWGRVKALYR
jgi:hypothetical protein